MSTKRYSCRACRVAVARWEERCFCEVPEDVDPPTGCIYGDVGVAAWERVVEVVRLRPCPPVIEVP